MSFINLRIQQLKNKKKDLKKHRKEINSTYNDPTECNREVIDIDDKINQEKLKELETQKLERQKKLQAKRDGVIQETREVIIETFKILRRIGIIRNTNEMSYMMGKQNKSYFRLYENNYISKIRYSTLEELKDSLFSVKTGLKEILDDNEIPLDWLSNKLQDIIEKISRVQFKIMELDYKGII